MVKVKVTQVRSTINRPKRQVDTILALGLGKIDRSRTFTASPQVMGMIKKVSHLVKVEEA